MLIPSKKGDVDITEENISALAQCYPHVDVRHELSKMWWWLTRNPSKQWTNVHSGMKKWLDKVEVEARQRGASRKVARTVTAWWTSNEATEAKARELGMWPPRPGEEWPQFKERLKNRLNGQTHSQASGT